jgi:hypothetical protein
MSYTIRTYKIVCHVHTTSYVHFRHTTLYTICGDGNIRCRMCDIRCRMLTYDIVRDVRCRTYDVVRLYPVYRTCDIARTMYNTMSYVARTTSYVMHVCRLHHLPSDEAYRYRLSLSCYRLSTPCYECKPNARHCFDKIFIKA